MNLKTILILKTHRRPRRENQKHQIAEPKAVDSTADTTVPTDTSVEVKTNSTNEIVTVSASPATLSQIAQRKMDSLLATAVSNADVPEYYCMSMNKRKHVQGVKKQIVTFTEFSLN